MEVCETAESVEELLRREADRTHTPMIGTFELLPLCNMDCKMCYIRLSREEMEVQGRLLTCDEWLHIAEEACEKGMLYLLLTGGEPLLYPDFKHLYVEISKMGVILEVNTNGTLIDEKWADFFSENGVRRLNITLYGKDNETYARLCNNPNGFTQIIWAAQLLKERNVPFRFNCSLTPDNVDQLSELKRVADSFGVVLATDVYMFPGILKGKTAQTQYRLTAERAVWEELYGYKPMSRREAGKKLAEMERLPRLKGLDGFLCHAGRCSFSVSWKGDFLSCGALPEPKISALEHSFTECWDYIVDICRKLPKSQKCIECDKQNICQVCPARCYTETGRIDGCPEYVCRMMECMVSELKKIATHGAEMEAPNERP